MPAHPPPCYPKRTITVTPAVWRAYAACQRAEAELRGAITVKDIALAHDNLIVVLRQFVEMVSVSAGMAEKRAIYEP